MLFHVDNVDNFVYNLIFQRFSRFQKVENFSHTNSPIHISKKNLCNLLISTYFDTQPLKISYLQYPAKYRQIPLPHTFFPCNSMIKKGPGNSSQSYKRIYLNRLCPKAMPLFFIPHKIRLIQYKFPHQREFHNHNWKSLFRTRMCWRG